MRAASKTALLSTGEAAAGLEKQPLHAVAAAPFPPPLGVCVGAAHARSLQRYLTVNKWRGRVECRSSDILSDGDEDAYVCLGSLHRAPITNLWWKPRTFNVANPPPNELLLRFIKNDDDDDSGGNGNGNGNNMIPFHVELTWLGSPCRQRFAVRFVVLP